MKNFDDLSCEIARLLDESILVIKDVAGHKTDDIARLVEIIVTAYRNGGKVVLFGNGGSAADAEHIACELVGRLKVERQALPAIALTTNTSLLTAIANDYGYNAVFTRQVEALATGKDVVVGISTSGDSPNVVEAIQAAKIKGARTIGLTGRSGGRLAKTADLTLKVASDSTPRIQEVHIIIGHIVCEMVEKELAGDA